MYQPQTTGRFERKFVKLTKKNPRLKAAVYKTIDILLNNPHDSALRTHKVITSFGNQAWSSRVIGDFRLIWTHANQNLIVLLLDLGGHSGQNKVYK